jgi:hypothetical protein
VTAITRTNTRLPHRTSASCDRGRTREFYRTEHFRHLARRENLYFVAPSTTRTNTLPLESAQLLRDHYGNTIVLDWAVTLCETKAPEKGATRHGMSRSAKRSRAFRATATLFL